MSTAGEGHWFDPAAVFLPICFFQRAGKVPVKTNGMSSTTHMHSERLLRVFFAPIDLQYSTVPKYRPGVTSSVI